ncbi:hypothetical protein Pmar_PMAR018012 [Perkinsus marinus ATCC 50983]|uniref:Uncharacterized protein n=1 Tax=Perkinsus marinus (strain ATCC 50983 / TXsc) TaxID=423536 RepID=C5KRR9_PERM5|nr:hypothetical protein Pmar_PMAR018012 [Perkinsus marinus ATCC 50983]EER12760.1 hypothetical protein Pmar_PMAR018012 [Perkinsus marinus ATCC 50983]|eukprot:XP_002780965.1 hypothetical protein Pmar_PMAR018012 [Perkinsus marinus ATCC 50983]
MTTASLHGGGSVPTPVDVFTGPLVRRCLNRNFAASHEEPKHLLQGRPVLGTPSGAFNMEIDGIRR